MAALKEDIYNADCLSCGKEFRVKHSRLKNGGGKYCSRKCQYERYRKRKIVSCAYCGKETFRTLSELRRKSKTKSYFCDKSCQCSWKNKRRKGRKISKLLKNLWGSWCSSSIRLCGSLGADANSVDPPRKISNSIFNLLSIKKRKRFLFTKRPVKKILYEFYWKKNYSQTKIAEIFRATHTSVRRWFIYYRIPIKSRSLSCGRNPHSLKNLELGKTPEVEQKSAKARRRYTKEMLIQKIREFVEKHSRVPTKNEFVKIRNYSYPNHTTFRDYFGTWNGAIRAAGYKPNEQLFSPRNSMTLVAKDGHACDSISEIIIDDWLFDNNISHIREYLYPEGRCTCDFVVDNIFIEFFGLAKALNINPHYREIMDNKKTMCKRYNIPLIELYEKDIYNLDQSLGKKLGLRLKQGNLF